MALHTAPITTAAPSGAADEAPLVLQAGASELHVPGADFVIAADYARHGHDLMLTGADGASVLVRGYYMAETPPTLVSDLGARMSPELVAKLAGPLAPGQYAQAGASPGPGAAIGKVELITGGATVTHANGVREALHQGDPVYKGDVVATGAGAKLGLVFVDKTTFALSE
ncbi:MAG: hypothetical protein AB7K86_05580, partial [Rhodospirillales bacterium]